MFSLCFDRARNRRLWTAVVGLCLVVAAGPAGAADVPPGFQGEGRCLFLLDKYVLPPQTQAAVNQVVSQAVAQHEKLFGFTASPEFRVRIRIFGRYEDYEKFTLANRDGRNIARNFPSLTNLSGYYSHATQEVVTWRQHDPRYLANNLLHEASHAIMYAHFRRMPPWLSEGCATYFAYPHQIQDTDDVGSLKYRWAMLNLWLRQKKLPALRSFLNLNQADWHKLDLAQAYTASWSLFQFLMSTPDKQRILCDLMQQLQPGPRGSVDCAARLEELYPGGLERLETDWHRWILVAGARVLGPGREELLKQIKPAQ